MNLTCLQLPFLIQDLFNHAHFPVSLLGISILNKSIDFCMNPTSSKCQGGVLEMLRVVHGWVPDGLSGSHTSSGHSRSGPWPVNSKSLGCLCITILVDPMGMRFACYGRYLCKH